ncbi:MAG: hypothetical protein ACRECF_00720 [Methyloceanibacter sp.]
MSAGWKARIERDPLDRSIKVFWAEVFANGTAHCVTGPLQLERTDEFTVIVDPFLCAEPEKVTAMLQALVDACFEYGIKPTGIENHIRANNAQAAHLADMRAMVGKLAGVDLP